MTAPNVNVNVKANAQDRLDLRVELLPVLERDDPDQAIEDLAPAVAEPVCLSRAVQQPLSGGQFDSVRVPARTGGPHGADVGRIERNLHNPLSPACCFTGCCVVP